MKKCKYIINDLGVAYVPRPTSVAAGQARHIWLKRKLGTEVHIASPPVWKTLCEKFEVHVLEETKRKLPYEQKRKTP
tara:strand:- start:522 stop:752 length:231 start_codon:yes stop_codon:yes gene_type:complete